MVFLDALAANASAHGVGIVFYSGNDDSLVAHRGTEGRPSVLVQINL
jgi:carboxypeptidase D